MDIRALLRRLILVSTILLAAKIATFGHATIVPVGLTKGGWAILTALRGKFHRWKIVGAVFALLVQRRWYVRKYSAGLRSGWLMR